MDPSEYNWIIWNSEIANFIMAYLLPSTVKKKNKNDKIHNSTKCRGIVTPTGGTMESSREKWVPSYGSWQNLWQALGRKREAQGPAVVTD